MTPSILGWMFIKQRSPRRRYSETGNLAVPTFGEADFTGFGPGDFRVADQPGTTPFVDTREFTESYAEHFPLKVFLIVPNGARVDSSRAGSHGDHTSLRLPRSVSLRQPPRKCQSQ